MGFRQRVPAAEKARIERLKNTLANGEVGRDLELCSFTALALKEWKLSLTLGMGEYDIMLIQVPWFSRSGEVKRLG